jgi:hypothetical protein
MSVFQYGFVKMKNVIESMIHSIIFGNICVWLEVRVLENVVADSNRDKKPKEEPSDHQETVESANPFQ